jgi:hypothetical protein
MVNHNAVKHHAVLSFKKQDFALFLFPLPLSDAYLGQFYI